MMTATIISADDAPPVPALQTGLVAALVQMNTGDCLFVPKGNRRQITSACTDVKRRYGNGYTTRSYSKGVCIWRTKYATPLPPQSRKAAA